MKNKKNLFFILENIEKQKIKQETINIKNLYIQKKEHIKQLKLLIKFRNEYITKLNIKLKSGISIDCWKVYNNFIFMLYVAIKENNNIVKKHEYIIKKNIDQWLKNHVKLKTWNFLNQKNKILFKNRQILKENIVSDQFSQFEFFKKRQLL
ncbi:flagellar export protein FliJ [Buchnera aphidicola]|uniref:Flagellar FliJ protein n=1 Tax=Buchnera aphidicola (Aphis nerii) TaxID=1241835 RepID=A0A4D6XYM8_9GAMM|nr:flagellar FliJ family protein [Buchnera aphidicola]QCI18641.1 flagellar export protein FliJ [Buchnera aphidicola (Aphis nerii)]